MAITLVSATVIQELDVRFEVLISATVIQELDVRFEVLISATVIQEMDVRFEVLISATVIQELDVRFEVLISATVIQELDVRFEVLISATVIQELGVRFEAIINVSKLVCDSHTVWYTGTNISEEHTASIFWVDKWVAWGKWYTVNGKVGLEPRSHYIMYIKKKKQSHYTPGQVQRVPEG